MFTIRLTTTLGESWGVSDLREEVLRSGGNEAGLRAELVEIASCDLERLAREGEWVILDDQGCDRCLAREILFDMLSSLDYMPAFENKYFNTVVAGLASSIYGIIDELLCEHPADWDE